MQRKLIIEIEKDLADFWVPVSQITKKTAD
jgi:hypothetical protein